jgi:hypothetical protein
VLGQFERMRPPDAVSGAGHDRYFSFEKLTHVTHFRR